MEAPFDLEQLITEGIKDLPRAYLAEFVLFVRRRASEQQPYNAVAIREELRLMNTNEIQHLEAEFANFDQQFPKE